MWKAWATDGHSSPSKGLPAGHSSETSMTETPDVPFVHVTSQQSKCELTAACDQFWSVEVKMNCEALWHSFKKFNLYLQYVERFWFSLVKAKTLLS